MIPPYNFTSLSYNLNRDFFKISRTKDSQFAGPYEELLLRTVKQNFEQEYLAFDLFESQKLNVLRVVLCVETLRFFNEEIEPKCTSVSEAFVMMRDQFTTASHMNTYMNEWNTLTFKSIQTKTHLSHFL